MTLRSSEGPLDCLAPDPAAVSQLVDEPVEILLHIAHLAPPDTRSDVLPPRTQAHPPWIGSSHENGNDIRVPPPGRRRDRRLSLRRAGTRTTIARSRRQLLTW